jgi:hypothetical protein
MIGSLIAVKESLVRRPTFKEVDKIYTKKELCDEIHKTQREKDEATEEKLKCIQTIKTDVTKIKIGLNLLLKKNGIEISDE